jgi:hypothetical protein
VQPAVAQGLRLTGSVVGSRTIRRGRVVRLRYALSAPARLTLEVRPARGRVQRISFGRRSAGQGVIRWSGKLRGRRVAGRYTLVLVASAGDEVRRTAIRVRLRR